MRQPGRSIYSDLTCWAFSNFLKTLLNKRNFNFKKEMDGQLLSQPNWAHFLSYEYGFQKVRDLASICPSAFSPLCSIALIADAVATWKAEISTHVPTWWMLAVF